MNFTGQTALRAKVQAVLLNKILMLLSQEWWLPQAIAKVLVVRLFK